MISNRWTEPVGFPSWVGVHTEVDQHLLGAVSKSRLCTNQPTLVPHVTGTVVSEESNELTNETLLGHSQLELTGERGQTPKSPILPHMQRQFC